MSHPNRTLVLLLTGLLTAAAIEAQEFRYLAFGDSITAGSFDELNQGGYPGRLDDVLGCSPGVCSVTNAGVGGEKTGEGVTRIGGLINGGGYDVLLLMEGTNDVYNGISNTTVEFNLETMAAIATNGAVDTVIASIIHFHPQACHGTTKDDEVEDLKNRITGIAGANSYYFANPWADLCPTQACFDAHYFDLVGCNWPPEDPVGHPDASGYDILASVWAGAIDSVPVPGAPTPVSPGGTGFQSPAKYTWSREAPVRATWYQVEIDGPGGNLLREWYKATDVCGPTSCTITAQLNLPNGSYSWRVRGRNPKGRSPFSAPLAFTIESPAGGPTLTLVSGSCAAGTAGRGAATPTAVTIQGDNFPAGFKAGLVMAGGNKGFVKGGTVCNGATFAISEPFVLPPTWVKADADGSFTAVVSGEQCLVQALALKTCEVSNLLVLP